MLLEEEGGDLFWKFISHLSFGVSHEKHSFRAPSDALPHLPDVVQKKCEVYHLCPTCRLLRRVYNWGWSRRGDLYKHSLLPAKSQPSPAFLVEREPRSEHLTGLTQSQQP